MMIIPSTRFSTDSGSMDVFQSSFYQRLQAFELDDPTDEFGVIHHLMKNQGD